MKFSDRTSQMQEFHYLQEAKYVLENLLDSSADAIGVVDAKGRFTRWNKAAEEIFGYSAAEIKAKHFSELYEYPAELEKMLAQLRRDGFVRKYEINLKKKDGSFAPFNLSINFLYDRQHNLTGSLCIARDRSDTRKALAELQKLNERLHNEIAERKRAEERQKNQTEFLTTLLETIPSPVFYKDTSGRYLGCNQAFEEFFVKPREQIIGKDVYEMGPPEIADRYATMDQALFERPGSQMYEGEVRAADGSVREVIFYKATFSDARGQIAGLVGVILDITERRRVEEALRESENRLANIIDLLPDATLVIDNEGKVIAWNKAIEEMTGISAKEMIGQGNYEYGLSFYGERRPILIDFVLKPQTELAKYTEIKREGLTLSAVAHFPNFRGRETYLYGKASILLDSQGNIVGAIESIRDITLHQKAEAERQRLSKLEAIGTLAGGIAHDFNNILTAIMGNISLALLDLQMREQSRERLTKADQACQQAQSLARQLLTFAKGGAPIKKLVSLEKLVAESASLACRGSQVRCEVSFPPDLQAVEVDPEQIVQAFQNLIINGIQALPEGGTIEISGENYKVGKSSRLPLEAGNYVKVSVKDKGVGIPEGYQQKLFDPYFTTRPNGSGLGLATVHSIINKHNGHISVKSEPGNGTTFEIFLPASNQKVFQKPEEKREVLYGKGRILVMDDEEMVREVLGQMLLILGYEVVFASNGAEAIEFFSQAQESGTPFNAVILDLTVPGGMGGREAIAKLLKINPQVKALVSSGYFDDPIMASFQKYGFVGVMAKPYNISELSRALNKALAAKA